MFRETTRDQYDTGDDTVDDVYRMYAAPRRRPTQRRPDPDPYFNEEDEYIDEDEMSSEDMGGFEPVRRAPSRSGTVSRGSKRPEMRTIRVKCHFNDDTRYLMIGAAIDFGDLESKIREKFAIKDQLKIRMKDEDDLITVADQDDLEMLLDAVRTQAKKERNEMGKMEVWIS